MHLASSTWHVAVMRDSWLPVLFTQCPSLTVQANLPHSEGKVYSCPKGAIEDSMTWSMVQVTVKKSISQTFSSVPGPAFHKEKIAPFQRCCQLIAPYTIGWQTVYEQGTVLGGFPNLICRNALILGSDHGCVIDITQQSCRVLLLFVYLSDGACIGTSAVLQ